MKKYIKKSLVLVCVLLVLWAGVWAINTVAEWWQVIKSAPATRIDAHNVCKKVSASASCSGDVFVPTSWSDEWLAFRTNKPACVTLEECTPTCDRPLTLWTWNNPNCTVPDIKICNAAGWYCQYWAGCNSNIGASGSYYSWITATTTNASWWLYGKLYSQLYVASNPTAVCGTWYRLPTSGEVKKLMTMLSENCWDYDQYVSSCNEIVSTLKLPLAWVYGKNQTYWSPTSAYRNKNIDWWYFYSPVTSRPNAFEF